MKNLSVPGGILASLLLAVAGLTLAQDEHKNERPQTAPPAENRKDEARPEDRRNDDRRNDDRRNQEPGSGDRPETTPPNEGRQKPQPQSGDRHPEKQQDERQMQPPADRQNQEQQPNQQQQSMGQQEREKDRHRQAQPQGQMQAGDRARAEGREGNRRRIPDSDFRANFGRQHRFAPGRLQVYQGRPQFTYGGYVFELVEAWPADWVYDDEDYYIDYVDDDYWLYSFHHPGVRLALLIVGGAR